MKKILILFVASGLILSACHTNKTQKGTVIGAGTGAVIGGVIGKRSDNTAVGAILGATIGGTVGAVIGSRMDKQAEEIQKDLGKEASVERVGEGIKVTFDSQLLFEYAKADLQEVNKASLRKLAESLKQYPNTEVLVIGHTDSKGTDNYNKTLSEQRAASVSNFLNSLGVPYSRLRTEGKGESEPVATNDTDAGRQQNRRVELAIFANDTMKQEAAKSINQN